MAQNTDFGKAIKKRLVDIGQTNKWLCSEVAGRTGMYFDDSMLSKICRGDERPSMAKFTAAISDILGLDQAS